MISFNFIETQFNLDQSKHRRWLNGIAKDEGFSVGEIAYVFCNDEYLLELNKQYLNHNTLTDVIGFDNTVRKKLHGDIFISLERVEENAKEYKVSVEMELRRVMAHGLLHFCGYTDKDKEQKQLMREREDHHLESYKAI